MARDWLIIDCPFICYRSYYGLHLPPEDLAPGLILNFFTEIKTLQDNFMSGRVAFCFDSQESVRQKAFPDYKAKRQVNPDLIAVKKQITILRDKYLPSLGFRNVFHARGFEADDVIASLCLSLPAEDSAVIISSDRDLLQLLSEKVVMYNPRTQTVTSKKSFRKQYGIEPSDWAMVKAIAGCSSDNVPGVPRVGEITAIKALKDRGLYRTKVDPHHKIVERNLDLVLLPHQGTPQFKLGDDELSMAAWEKLVKGLGESTRIPHPFFELPRKDSGKLRNSIQKPGR